MLSYNEEILESWNWHWNGLTKERSAIMIPYYLFTRETSLTSSY